MPSSTLTSSDTLASSPSASNRFCCVMLGSGGVGKSALSIQYVQGVFVSVYDPTIMDSLLRSDTVDGSTVTVTVVDTAGQEDYIDQTTPYIRMADLCIFVYSVTDASSIAHVSTLFDHAVKARQGKEGRMPFLVVGNKADLHEHRQVTADQGRRLAITLAGRLRLSGEEVLAVSQSPLFMETSAKNREDAVQLFHTAVVTANRVRATGAMCGLARSTHASAASSLLGTDDDDEATASEAASSGTFPSPLLSSSAAQRATTTRRDSAIPAAAASTSNRPSSHAMNAEDGSADTDSEHGPILVIPTPNDDPFDILDATHGGGSGPSSRVSSPKTAATKQPKKGSSSKKKKQSKAFRCTVL